MNAVSLVLNFFANGATAPVDEGGGDTTIAAAIDNASTGILEEIGAKKGQMRETDPWLHR